MTVKNSPKIELFVRTLFGEDDAEKIRDEKNHYVERLAKLVDEEKIEDYEVFTKSWDKKVSATHRTNRGGAMKFAVDKYDEFSNWANSRGLSITPHFEEVDVKGNPMIKFPDMCLAAYDGLSVKGVFPCSDGPIQYSIDDYISALEEGEDWIEWGQKPSDVTPDYGKHGDIKFHLMENHTEILGQRWKNPEDEVSLRAGGSEFGRIDLVFEHSTKSKYLLVEVKPEKREVDSAMGQILRYKHQFLSERSMPDVDVELAIAAPNFFDSHQKAADEIGISLIEV